MSYASNKNKLELAGDHPVSVTGTVLSVESRLETLRDEDTEKTVYVYDIQVTYPAENGIQKTVPFYGLSERYTIGSEIALLCRDDLSDPIIASSAEGMDSFTVRFIYGVGGVLMLIGLITIIVPFVKHH